MKKVSKLIFMLFLGFPFGSWAFAPNVVVTIKPIHSLVVGIMEGVKTPALLLPDFASPHTYTLKPSDAKLLHEADLIIWVGPELESFLEKPLVSLGHKAHQLSLMDLPKITHYAYRTRLHDHPEKTIKHETHIHQGLDPHLWLSTSNAKLITQGILNTLVALDPENTERYEANTKKILQKLEALDSELHALLTPIQAVPFLVYHDAYQYFERDYHLNGQGPINWEPGIPFSAKNLKAVTNQIKSQNIQCVFTEPEFKEVKLQALEELQTIKIHVLDPLGAFQPKGRDAYFAIMQNMAHALKDCLKDKD